MSSGLMPVTLDTQPLYINIWDYHRESVPFNIFIGGRGMGKTYSGLEGAIDNGEQFIYMRRLLSELEEVADVGPDADANPFTDINKDRGFDFTIRMETKKRGGIYHTSVENDQLKYSGLPIGMAMAMASIARMKGFSAPNSKYWLYDEFIKEPHVAKIKDEGIAIFSAYESLCRNREFQGLPPIYMDFCANATDIYNEVFKELGIVAEAEKMIAREKQHKYFYDRGLGLHLLSSTEEFRKKKQETAIMKLTKGTRYYDMALNNTFSYNDFSLIKYMNVKGFRPICHVIGIMGVDAYIYRKKGEPVYYVSYAEAKCEAFTVTHSQEVMRFQRRIGILLQDPYTYGRLFFESYELKAFILELIL